MVPRLLLVLALSLACAGCESILDILGIHPATLELVTKGERSLDDPHGYAGLRVVLAGDVQSTFDASDFPVAPFGVPASGTVRVSVSLSQGSRVVAQRTDLSWDLSSNINKWELRFIRGRWPLDSGINPDDVARKVPDPECGWFFCHTMWRVEIDEDARSSEDEALWLILWMKDLDQECVDLCPS